MTPRRRRRKGRLPFEYPSKSRPIQIRSLASGFGPRLRQQPLPNRFAAARFRDALDERIEHQLQHRIGINRVVVTLGRPTVDVSSALVDQPLTRLAAVQRAAAAVREFDDPGGDGISLRIGRFSTTCPPAFLKRSLLRLQGIPCFGIDERLTAAVGPHAKLHRILQRAGLTARATIRRGKFPGGLLGLPGDTAPSIASRTA
jgi:hypothetical protein